MFLVPASAPAALPTRSAAAWLQRRVKGIGEKTSLSLVAEWGSVEVIFDNKEHIRETRARNCLASDGAWEAAMLSKRLVTLNAHVRCGPRADDLR